MTLARVRGDSVPEIDVRFYAELNDFLPEARRQRSFVHHFHGTPAVKDVIESLGPPHTEVELILVDGEPVGWGHRLRGGERVAVYPVFEELDLGPLRVLRRDSLRRLAFVADGHLGRLARYLRLLGFDTWYQPQADDAALSLRSAEEGRILLTRDRGLLKRSEVQRGYCVRSTDAERQVREVAERFHLERDARPFSRCLRCNRELEALPAAAARSRVPPRVAGRFTQFWACSGCGRVYWRGSHYEAMVHGPVATALGARLVSYEWPDSARGEGANEPGATDEERE